MPFGPTGPIVPPEGPRITLTIDQGLAKKPTDKTTGEPVIRVVLEIFRVNGEPFDGILSDTDLFEIWECLGREVTEIQQKGNIHLVVQLCRIVNQKSRL